MYLKVVKKRTIWKQSGCVLIYAHNQPKFRSKVTYNQNEIYHLFTTVYYLYTTAKFQYSEYFSLMPDFQICDLGPKVPVSKIICDQFLMKGLRDMSLD